MGWRIGENKGVFGLIGDLRDAKRGIVGIQSYRDLCVEMLGRRYLASLGVRLSFEGGSCVGVHHPSRRGQLHRGCLDRLKQYVVV